MENLLCGITYVIEGVDDILISVKKIIVFLWQ